MLSPLKYTKIKKKNMSYERFDKITIFNANEKYLQVKFYNCYFVTLIV